MGSILGNNTRRPDISFYNSGRIDITAAVARVLGLRKGDVIDVECLNGEYLLYVRLRANEAMGRHEAQCFSSKDGYNNFRAYSKRLSNAIIKICGATTEARLTIGGAVELPPHGVGVPLITRNNLSPLRYDTRD